MRAHICLFPLNFKTKFIRYKWKNCSILIREVFVYTFYPRNFSVLAVWHRSVTLIIFHIESEDFEIKLQSRILLKNWKWILPKKICKALFKVFALRKLTYIPRIVQLKFDNRNTSIKLSKHCHIYIDHYKKRLNFNIKAKFENGAVGPLVLIFWR